MALVKYNGKNVLGVAFQSGISRIMPGVNDIQDDVLNKMKTHPLFQTRVNNGIIQILQDSIGKDGKRTVEDMLTHIPNIFDVKLLKKLIESDGRAPVVKAAQLQLDTIKNPAKVKAEQEDDEHFK